jgi:TfoX/Sxy family transcriptional regulator of competence genes
MAWVKVPPEHHPLFRAALPDDPRVETRDMFGGVAAKVNGHLFAGLFGRSTMVLLPEAERAAALALPGASLFDPMSDGRARSDKVMLPEALMHDPPELRRWIARAFEGAASLPAKAAKTANKGKAKAKPAVGPAKKIAPKAPAKTKQTAKR